MFVVSQKENVSSKTRPPKVRAEDDKQIRNNINIENVLIPSIIFCAGRNVYNFFKLNSGSLCKISFDPREDKMIIVVLNI